MLYDAFQVLLNRFCHHLLGLLDAVFSLLLQKSFLLRCLFLGLPLFISHRQYLSLGTTNEHWFQERLNLFLSLTVGIIPFLLLITLITF